MSQIGGFFDLWNPVLLLMVVVVGYVYSRFVVKGMGISQMPSQFRLSRSYLFYAGLVLFYIGQGSPINYIGHHYLFSMHMLQQTILYLIVPIFIWLGTPAWVLRAFYAKSAYSAAFFHFSHGL